MADMADQAIKSMRSVKALAPDKPFFIYFAPGAMHVPLHVPKEWIAKYKGRFDAGWDKLREETLAKQITLGVVPQGTKLAPKPEFIKDWDSLSPDEKRLFARQTEVFAGFGEYTEHEIGRLVQAMADQGQLDNTLVLYVVGDGASAEGGANALDVLLQPAGSARKVTEVALAKDRSICGGEAAKLPKTEAGRDLGDGTVVRRPQTQRPAGQMHPSQHKEAFRSDAELFTAIHVERPTRDPKRRTYIGEIQRLAGVLYRQPVEARLTIAVYSRLADSSTQLPLRQTIHEGFDQQFLKPTRRV